MKKIFFSCFKSDVTENILSAINLVILSLTLFVLIFYAYDTHRIANQSQETSLRPVILRAGYIPSWGELKPNRRNSKTQDGSEFRFMILKNIATDLTGHIVINRYRYPLFFASEITAVSGQPNQHKYLESWSWQLPGSTLISCYFQENGEQTNAEDGIELSYHDIEGNQYCTTEDVGYSQRAIKKG